MLSGEELLIHEVETKCLLKKIEKLLTSTGCNGAAAYHTQLLFI